MSNTKEEVLMNQTQITKMTLLNLYYKKHIQLLKIFEKKRRLLDKLQSVYDIYSNLCENFNHIFLPEDVSYQIDESSKVIDISLKKAEELLLKIKDMNTYLTLKETSQELCVITENILQTYIAKASNFKETQQNLKVLKDDQRLCHHLSLAILGYL